MGHKRGKAEEAQLDLSLAEVDRALMARRRDTEKGRHGERGKARKEHAGGL